MLLNPYVFTTGVGGGGGITYFFEERFEAVGGYQNSWTEAGTGTITENYTGVVLEGTQSLRIAGTAQQPITSTTFSADKSELWAFFRFRVVTSLTTARPFFVLRNSGATQVGGIQFGTNNVLVPLGGSAAGTGTTDLPVTGTDYNCWFHWLKGTGSNAVASVGFSTTGTEPTSGNAFKTTTVGNATTDAHDLRLGWTINTGGEIIVDKILFSITGTIGDSPA